MWKYVSRVTLIVKLRIVYVKMSNERNRDSEVLLSAVFPNGNS